MAGDVGLWLVLGLVWCLNLWLVFQLGRALGLSAGWCLLLGLWLTANPFFLFYHGHLMTESLAMSFCIWIALLSVQFLQRPNWSVVVSLAVISALGHLVRSQVMLAVAALWLVAAFQVPWRRLIPFFLVFAVLHLAVIAPWLWRMHQVGAGFSSTELKLGINLFQFGGSPVDDPYHVGPNADWQFPVGFEAMTPAERNGVLLRAALKGIAERPKDYLRKCGQRVFYLLSPVPNFTASGRLQYWGMVVGTTLFFYSCWAAILLRLILFGRLTRAEWLMLGALLVWYLFHFGVNASIRNRLPSDTWCAALALSLWFSRTVGAAPKARPILALLPSSSTVNAAHASKEAVAP
jgi:hypothetical protein